MCECCKNGTQQSASERYNGSANGWTIRGIARSLPAFLNHQPLNSAWRSVVTGMRGVGTERRKSYNGYDHRRLPPNALQKRAWGGVTLVSVTALCAWTLCSTFADTGADQIELAAARGDKLDVAVGRGDKLAVLEPSTPASNAHVSLFDPRYYLGFSPGTFATSTPLQVNGNLQVAASAQLSSVAAARNTPDIPASRGERVAQTAVLPRPRPATAPQIASPGSI